jgi:hypothetical protein
MEALLPTVPRVGEDLPEVMPAKGESRGRVGLLLGCVQRYFLPQVNVAAARALNEFGYDVVVPKEQGCCGSLLVHEGARERAMGLARKTIDVFERAGVDMIAVNAAGCGSVMKEYWELFHNDRAYAHRAETFSKKVRDVSQILAQQPMEGGLGELPPPTMMPAISPMVRELGRNPGPSYRQSLGFDSWNSRSQTSVVVAGVFTIFYIPNWLSSSWIGRSSGSKRRALKWW